jgi:hypothetical protein
VVGIVKFIVSIIEMDLKIKKKFETEKGKPYILVDGHKYREFNVLKKCGNIRYRCTNKNCSASLLVNKDVTIVISMLNDHNHNVIAENIVGRQIINSHIKRKCEDDLLTRPNKMIRAELQNAVNDIELVHSDVRVKFQSVEESKVQIFDRRETIISNTGELFYHMETISNPIMFTCATNLEILSRSSHIFADGTFSHSSKHYEQLYTIHTLQNGFYIPIVKCFLTSNSTLTYIDMWLTIVELCLKLTGINLKLSLAQSTFHFDFEKSIHNAVKEIFPNCRILACRFHLNQAWFRHIQKDSQLLNEYKSNSEFTMKFRVFG